MSSPWMKAPSGPLPCSMSSSRTFPGTDGFAIFCSIRSAELALQCEMAHRQTCNVGGTYMSRYEWAGDNAGVERLKRAVSPARDRVINHPMYHRLDGLGAVLTFMEHHVFAVWDFMSLLKSLERYLYPAR